MGRELKRVALDFAWPLNKVWSGYECPHQGECDKCDGTGSTLAARRLGDLVSLLMLSAEDAVSGKCHPYFIDAPLHNTSGKVCDASIMELTAGLAGRSPSRFGHDAIDRWSAIRKIVAAAGMPKAWGTCTACNGEGVPPDIHALQEAWKPTEPPTGEGYQVWETVSDGSPISPVFATPDELARHMALARDGSYEQWMKFITGPGWAPSAVYDESGFRSGVASL